MKCYSKSQHRFVDCIAVYLVICPFSWLRDSWYYGLSFYIPNVTHSQKYLIIILCFSALLLRSMSWCSLALFDCEYNSKLRTKIILWFSKYQTFSRIVKLIIIYLSGVRQFLAVMEVLRGADTVNRVKSSKNEAIFKNSFSD